MKWIIYTIHPITYHTYWISLVSTPACTVSGHDRSVATLYSHILNTTLSIFWNTLEILLKLKVFWKIRWNHITYIYLNSHILNTTLFYFSNTLEKLINPKVFWKVYTNHIYILYPMISLYPSYSKHNSFYFFKYFRNSFKFESIWENI